MVLDHSRSVEECCRLALSLGLGEIWKAGLGEGSKVFPDGEGRWPSWLIVLVLLSSRPISGRYPLIQAFVEQNELLQEGCIGWRCSKRTSECDVLYTVLLFTGVNFGRGGNNGEVLN